jgi:hypothetical protein
LLLSVLGVLPHMFLMLFNTHSLAAAGHRFACWSTLLFVRVSDAAATHVHALIRYRFQLLRDECLAGLSCSFEEGL